MLFGRHNHLGLFCIPSEQYGRVTDALDQFCSGLINDSPDYFISCITITHADFKLDKLMCIQGDFHFCHDAVFQAMLAYHDDGLEGMCEPTKMTGLIIGKGQGGSPRCQRERIL